MSLDSEECRTREVAVMSLDSGSNSDVIGLGK